MKRLKLLILLFGAALSIPLAWFIFRTYRSLEHEEHVELRYFADTLFNEMEESLAGIIRREEGRAIDEYNYLYTPVGSKKTIRSPLSGFPPESYILGYLQNNPDGSFQTPFAEKGNPVSYDISAVIERLEDVNRIFNTKKTAAADMPEAPSAETRKIPSKKEVSSLADKYLDVTRTKKQKAYLGQEQKRVEEITPHQALNIAQAQKDSEKDTEKLQVEFAPMQSVFINDNRIFIFRRIAIRNEIYRQGFVIMTIEFLNHLIISHFINQPMARFTGLDLQVMDANRESASIHAGIKIYKPKFSLERRFPRPFSFLRAKLTCKELPKSASRRTLNIMVSALAAVILMGLFAIYRSARAVMDISDRKTKFVSSVTHELKTPLTNIRMYIEMLEQGIARTPEREQEYFRILVSESARLSRLINNVLNFSRLERKEINLQIQEGNFEEVIAEVRTIMHEKLRQEGFDFKVERKDIVPFKYDREVMIQVLINLIENSMKFGKTYSKREITLFVYQSGKRMMISVSDTGPGIPCHALKKVFDDFYRVNNSLTRNTSGTGIGLAFVRKFIKASSGTVKAANNEGPGCTITISLPL